ncbi:MAG: type I-D CRISPR-associated helicase Cas3', partial [Synechococcales bacterium]|nr:type I-D CRISPR-associated helicase Cas3' [Synechococcales bacterium]
MRLGWRQFPKLYSAMTTFTIQLKPVYSKTVETPEGITLPQNWQLSWHQAETFRLLDSRDIDVIFNTAMTGDGKSLAAYLRSMVVKFFSTMAMYPTNELARDQERQVKEYKAKFQPKHNPQIYRMTGSTLADFVETNQLPSKQQGIINRVDNSEILLTNPDIFHYIHDFRYVRQGKKASQGDNPDKLFRKLDESYRLFIFDEFHIFSSPQIASILNAMLLIKHTATPRKFLFLSATPSELLKGFLERSGLRYHAIDPVTAGAYRFSPSDEPHWRQISQPITVTFPGDLEPNIRSGYDWLLENAEEIILKFFLAHPGSKGAIILNSIASVYKLLAILQPLFRQHGLTV